MKLQGAKIGLDFKEKLFTNGLLIAEVNNIFQKVINLKLANGELLSISTRNVLNAPNNLILAVSTKFDLNDLGVRPKEKVILTSENITFKKAKIKINLTKVECWNDNLFDVTSTLSLIKFEQNFEFLMKIVTKREVEKGLGELSKYLSELMQGEEIDNSFNPIAEIASPIISDLIQATLIKDKAKMIDKSSKLIGLGPGLTPAGDDFLVGFYTMLQVIEIKGKSGYIDSEFKQKLLDNVSGNTTLVSEVTLAYTLDAKLPEVVLRLVEALLLGDEGEVFHRALIMLARGSTSGTDIAMGMLVGGLILLEVLDR